jgi:electron transfer flavoprotein alpha subunit
MKILILAQHDNEILNFSTAHVVNAAKNICDDICILIAGYNCNAVAEQAATLDGVGSVILANAECYETQLPENISTLVASIADDYSHILGAANTFGKNVLPRIAALLDVQAISDVIEIESESIFHRPIYAGNLIAIMQMQDHIKVISVRTTSFSAVGNKDIASKISINTDEFIQNNSRRLSLELVVSERPELEISPVVVSGGRGLGSSENFSLLYSIADKLQGNVGASRAAVDAGYLANDLQIGQTGRVVAPELYLAVGISGAIQHLAGMKDSRIVVAINKDPDAPIFDVADYGLVADLFDAVPELDTLLETSASV